MPLKGVLAMPTNYAKYIIAPNGTTHLRNNDSANRRKSWCGRVTLGTADAKGSNKTPANVCGRCTQLHDGAANKVSVPAKASNAPKAPGRPRKAVKASAGIVDTVTVPASDTVPWRTKDGVAPESAGSLKGGVAQHKLYANIDRFLLDNDVPLYYTTDLLGTYVSFEVGEWAYRIWAPEFNPNGKDSGWVIVYRPTDADPMDSDADVYVPDAEPYLTDADVIDWIVADTGFTKRARVTRRAAKAAKPAAKVDPATGVDNSALALVTSHLVTIVSNADSAGKLAKKGKLSPNVVKALADLKSAADELRKVIN